MKKMIIAMAAGAILSSCENQIDVMNDGEAVKCVTFTVQGDFDVANTPFTRSLTADGKEMTDVWVLDYVNGSLVQQVHQSSSDADFGQPTLTLAYGSHHIYFVASRSQSPTLNTDDHTLTFEKVRDTFYKDLSLEVSGASNSSQSVTLNRIATKLKLVLTDAIPEGATTINVTPGSWYYGFDYMTGNPTAAVQNQAITVNIPASEIGVTNEAINIYGFSSASEWNTNISVVCKSVTDAVLGSATINDAPFKQNRITELSGPLFSSGSVMGMSLSSDWLESETATW